MGKFAGFLKRSKNIAQKAIHGILKGATMFKEGTRKYYVEPMVGVLNTVMPEVKPLTDAIFKVDDGIIKGMNWLTDKTDTPHKKILTRNEILRNQLNNKMIHSGPIKSNNFYQEV